MPRSWSISRRLSGLAAMCLAVASCSSSTAGAGQTPAYQPLDPQAMSVSEVHLPNDLIGISPDARRGVTIDDGDRACVVQLDPAGQVTQQAPVCVTQFKVDRSYRATFSPSGEQLVLLPQALRTGSIGVGNWLVESATGTPTRIVRTDAAGGAVASSATPAPTDSAPREISSDLQVNAMFLPVWTSDSTVVAAGMADMFVIDAKSGSAEPIPGVVPDAPDSVISAVAKDNRVVLGTVKRVFSLDLATKQVGPDLAITDSNVVPQLYGISPDGSTLLSGGLDPRTFKELPVRLTTLQSGESTTIDTGGKKVIAGGFSPDGRQVALLAASGELLVASAEGGAPVTVGAIPGEAFGPVQWSSNNVLTTGTDLSGAPPQAWRLVGA